ncbi:hypothetical protein [Bradyrhizobium iriomotense]|uniref:Uncharacterized protein n=1 Tax=Bradyrhizobium iriomotense TaxID=441950 RepID=A0ABQ6B338_9BRAD|nr:hypothetical protein [Bradyrhizobium iriomotense]GLR86573.1 hypothetical protein GCM10007857_32840 [Bradyrhizobium iriomotense]
MLKHGICTLEQLDRSGLGRLAETRRFFHRLCDIALYEALARRGGSDDEALQAAVLNLFPITNGAYKRTSRQRFGTFDREVLSILAQLFSSNARLSVHDVAVSDGRTACDFYRVLSAQFGGLDFLASDLCLRVTRLSFPEARLSVVVDENDVPLQLVRPPFVLNLARTESWLYPVNHLLRLFWRARAMAVLDAARAGDEALIRDHILLLCSEARKYLDRCANFQIKNYDIFSPPVDRYHVVRAMNVLNPSYFSPAQLTQAIANLRDALHEGGVLVLGSNGEAGSTVHGGAYQRRDNQLVEIWSCGGGPPFSPVLSSDQRPSADQGRVADIIVR